MSASVVIIVHYTNVEDGGMGVNPSLVLHIASLLILTVFVIEVRVVYYSNEN